jgi:hypothetical protein
MDLLGGLALGEPRINGFNGQWVVIPPFLIDPGGGERDEFVFDAFGPLIGKARYGQSGQDDFNRGTNGLLFVPRHPCRALANLAWIGSPEPIKICVRH